MRAASSSGQVQVLLRAAVPKIQRALGPKGPTWDEFRLALIESRLRGIRRRWLAMADSLRGMTNEQLRASFENHVAGLLGHMEGKRGFPQDLAATAAALLEAKDYKTYRTFVRQTFRDAAAAVTPVMAEDDFDILTGSPGFERGLAVYKDLLEKPMAESHERNEGVFSDALGPLDTYIPLIPAGEKTRGRTGRATPYRKPRNVANQFATGLAEEYDAGMDAFREKLSRAIRANNKAALLGALEEQ